MLIGMCIEAAIAVFPLLMGRREKSILPLSRRRT